MLVLTRKTGERIRIGDEIEVVVLAVRGDQVRVGLVAPRGVTICRGELYERVRDENLAAAQSASLAGQPVVFPDLESRNTENASR